MTSTGRKKKIAKKNAENAMQEQERPVLDNAGGKIEDSARIALASASQPKIAAVDYSPSVQASVQNEKGISMDAGSINAGKAVQQPAAYPTAQASVQNEKGIIPKEKPVTLESMLKEKRQRYIQDKTDALKMQKYYALADTLSAIGRMGGAAIGGAIGGNVMDSAPAAPEYKENRGYLQAFEQAKRATERLDKLDDTEFSLAYSKAQRDEQRAYEAKKTAEEREYNNKKLAENRKWQEEQTEKEQKWKEEESEKNRRHQMTLKNAAILYNSDYAQRQFDTYHPKLPVEFNDGTHIKMNDIDFKAMFDNFKGQKIGDTTITADNFDYLLRQNPDFFKGYLIRNGFLEKGKDKKESAKDYAFPSHFSRVPEEFTNKGANKGIPVAKNSASEKITADDEKTLKSLGVEYID